MEASNSAAEATAALVALQESEEAKNEEIDKLEEKMKKKEKAVEEKGKQLEEEKIRYAELSDKLAEVSGHNRVSRSIHSFNVIIYSMFLQYRKRHLSPTGKRSSCFDDDEGYQAGVGTSERSGSNDVCRKIEGKKHGWKHI